MKQNRFTQDKFFYVNRLKEKTEKKLSRIEILKKMLIRAESELSMFKYKINDKVEYMMNCIIYGTENVDFIIEENYRMLKNAVVLIEKEILEIELKEKKKEEPKKKVSKI